MIKELKTTWSKINPPFGAFDDFIILESIESGNNLKIRPEEFDFLMTQILEQYNKGKTKYVQILSEWNEVRGFNGIEETPSIIKDVDDLIDSIKRANGSNQQTYGYLTDTDLQLIINFLNDHKEKGLKIKKD
jgi:hypothetical protein